MTTLRTTCRWTVTMWSVWLAVVVLSAHRADAQLPWGPVTISGTRYINGVLNKVTCPGKNGNFLDASTGRKRIFVPASSCPLFVDTGMDGRFVFAGEEEQIIQNNKKKNVGVFNGNIVNDIPAIGTAHGQIAFRERPLVFKSDKGIITYSYFDGTNSIVFFGKYAAKF